MLPAQSTLDLPALSLHPEAQQHGSPTQQAVGLHSASHSAPISPDAQHHAEGISAGQSEQSLEAFSSFQACSRQKAHAPAANSFADSANAAAISEADDAICTVDLHTTAQTASLAALHDAAPDTSVQGQIPDSLEISAEYLVPLEPHRTASEDAASSYSAAESASADTAHAADGKMYAASTTSHVLSVATEVAGVTVMPRANPETDADSDIFGLLANSTFVTNPPFASLSVAKGAVFRMLATEDQLQQQMLVLPSVTAHGLDTVDTEGAITLRQCSSEEAEQAAAHTSLLTDSASKALYSTASNAELTSHTATLESLPPAGLLQSDSGTSAAVATLSHSQPSPQPSSQLLPLPLLHRSVPSSAQLGIPLDRCVSESALLSDVQSELLVAPAKPKRRSLLARLRPRRLSQGGLEGSALGRTASDPSLLTRQSSADLAQNQKVKRRSLLGMLRRGSSVDVATAVAENSSSPVAAAEAYSDVVKDPVEAAAVATAATPEEDRAGTYPRAEVVPQRSISVGSGTLLDQAVDLQPQSAPASPRGRTGAAPEPHGRALLPSPAPGRVLSDPSMLIRLPSGLYSAPATPRRMSLLGRLSRGRRSNSIAPEPGREHSHEEDQQLSKQPLNELALPEAPSSSQWYSSNTVEDNSSQIREEFRLVPSIMQTLANQPVQSGHASAARGLAEQPLDSEINVEQVEQQPALQLAASETAQADLQNGDNEDIEGKLLEPAFHSKVFLQSLLKHACTGAVPLEAE